jgi:cellulose biosynthesis protein BcsQ
MKILLMNQKGGVGKTTVTLLLAAALKAAGVAVKIKDVDPQKSAETLGKMSLGLEVADENEDPNTHIIIDTPGHLDIHSPLGSQLKQLVHDADRIIVVLHKSAVAFHASFLTAELVKTAKRPEAKAYVLFNEVRKNTSIGARDEAEMAKGLGLPALQNSIPLSSSIERALEEGWKVVQGPHRELLVRLALEVMS